MKRVAILGPGAWARRLRSCSAGSSATSGSGRATASTPPSSMQHAVNERHLPGVVLPERSWSRQRSRRGRGEADLIVAAVPTSYLRATLERLAR